MTNAADLEKKLSEMVELEKELYAMTDRETELYAAEVLRGALADLEKEFYAAVEKAPEGIRSEVEQIALQNSFAVETYKEYDNDIERWEVAIMLVAEILDAPSDYGL